MDLLVIPYTNGDGVCFSNVAEKQTRVSTSCFSTQSDIIVSVHHLNLYQECDLLMAQIESNVYFIFWWIKKGDLEVHIFRVSHASEETGDSQVIVLIPFGVQCALDCVCRMTLTWSIHYDLGERIWQTWRHTLQINCLYQISKGVTIQVSDTSKLTWALQTILS